MLIPSRIICLLSLTTSLVNSRQTDGPEAIKITYEKVLSDPGGGGQNLTLIEEAFHENWGRRPNLINLTCKGAKCGPGSKGVKGIMGLFNVLFEEIHFDRQHTLFCSNSYLCGDKVVVMNRLHGTMGTTLQGTGLKEFPVFPGIEPEKVFGKKFDTMSIEVHVMKDGKLKKTYAAEDWLAAREQILGKPKTKFMNPPSKPGQLLTEIPTSIDNFYEKILRDPLGSGQNSTLIHETFHKDWQSRPNCMNPYGKGPGADGLMKCMGYFGTWFPQLRFERKHTMLCGDRIVVVSKMVGTLTRNPPGPPFQQEDNRVAFFPEVPLEKVLGKKIEIMAIDIHFMKDGKFHQSWHIEDFASGVDQALNGASPPDFGFDEEFINF